MTRTLGARLRADHAERLARYAALRDGGLRPVDAAQEMSLSTDGAGARYERWYRAQRGLPPRPRGLHDPRAGDNRTDVAL